MLMPSQTPPISGSNIRKQKIAVDVDVNTEKLQDASDLINEICTNIPNITIRNNEVVNVTINYYK